MKPAQSATVGGEVAMLCLLQVWSVHSIHYTWGYDINRDLPR